MRVREETDSYFYGMHLALIRANDRDIALHWWGLGLEERSDLEAGLAVAGRTIDLESALRPAPQTLHI